MKLFLLAFMIPAVAVAQHQSAPPNATQKQLDQIGAEYKKAKAAYAKSPNAKTKSAMVIATDRLATASMTSEVINPRTRYPLALGLYQQALNLDPKNAEAKNNAEMIDSVYKGMIAKAKAKLKANASDKAAAAQLARFMSIYSNIHRPLP
jgi:tetratricopeptide (TPR) repeat protein